MEPNKPIIKETPLPTIKQTLSASDEIDAKMEELSKSYIFIQNFQMHSLVSLENLRSTTINRGFTSLSDSLLDKSIPSSIETTNIQLVANWARSFTNVVFLTGYIIIRRRTISCIRTSNI